jgi:hypothetical protein
MTTKKAIKSHNTRLGLPDSTTEKPVALTLKIDSHTYMRLSMLRARDRKTAQNILTAALEAFLRQAGV